MHAFVNPTLFLTLHRGLRQGMTDVCCGCCESFARWILGATAPPSPMMQQVHHQSSHYESSMKVLSTPDLPLPHSWAPMTPSRSARTTASSACDLSDVAMLKAPLPPQPKHHHMVSWTGLMICIFFSILFLSLITLR